MKSHTEITAIKYKLGNLNANLDKDYENGIPSNVLENLNKIRDKIDEVIEKQSICKKCQGTGYIIDLTSPAQTPTGFLKDECPRCMGRGELQ